MFKGLSALKESFRFAVNAMKNNILRTFLSLLGVTVGIFSIIGVLAAVDSLDKEIRGSLSSLDQSTMLLTHVSFGPTEVPRWKREQFPVVTYEEYQYLQRSLPDLKAISYGLNVAPQTIKYNDETLENVQIGSTTEGYYDIESIEFQEGRFFSEQEAVNGNPVAVIGDEIKNKLFGENGSAIGKKIRLYSRKFKVIGVMKKEGAGMFGPSKDEVVIVPATIVMRIYGGKNKSVFPIITMLPEDDADYDGFLAQAEQKLRQKRGLKPDEVSTFFINQLKGFAAAIGEVIGVLKLIGWGIGGFSLLVGGFGIANIMFVSVKERTNLIGIQKALGAKRRFILFQFLFESILLSVLGGIIGLVLVYLITLVLTNVMDDFEFVLSLFNIMLGLSVTFIIGIIAGIVPAIGASRLDPVEAIRTGM